MKKNVRCLRRQKENMSELFARIATLVILSVCYCFLYDMEPVIASDMASFNQNTSTQKEVGTFSSGTVFSEGATLSLSQEERSWLRDHPVIRVVQDPGWPPVEFADTKGNPSGMTSDYLKLVERRLGVTFERVKNLSWQDAYTRLKHGEIDMTTSVTVTPERTGFWVFTKPYMKIPIVIFAQADVTYIAGMHELSGKKIAVVDGYAVNEWIPRDFPEIKLVKVKNSNEGIALLQKKDVFAYIDNMLVVSYYLAKLKAANVKIAGETPYINAQSMAVRKDWPVLAGILQKALDSISETEKEEIYKRWVPLHYEHGFNFRMLWQSLALFIVILLGLVVWNLKLSREIRHRKIAETALGKSEKRFQQLFRAAAVPLGYVDQEGIIVDINDHFVQIFGYTHKEIPTLNEWYQLAYPDPDYQRWARERWEAAVKIASENNTEIKPIEYKVRCKNGDVRTVLISGNMVGSNLIATIFDITELKQKEQAIKESEKKFRQIYNNILDVYYEASLEGIILEISPSVEKISHYKREELIGKSLYDLYTNPLDRDTLIEIILTQESVRDYEISLNDKDAEQHICSMNIELIKDEQNNPVKIVGIFRDVTDRKETEQALILERTFIDAIFNSIPGMLYLYDADANLVRWNKKHELMTGYASEELSKMTLLDWYKDDAKSQTAVIKGIKNTLEKGFGNAEANLQKKDGTIIPIYFTASPLTISGKQYFTGIGIDISDRRRSEEEREKLQVQLNQAQKMESIGTLAGGIAHDFNNILFPIVGHTEMLLDDVSKDSPFRNSLNEIYTGALRARELVKQILTFSRQDSNELSLMKMQPIIKEALNLIRSTIPTTISINQRLQPNCRAIKADPTQIHQVVINLATNAYHAMEETGGELMIGLKEMEIGEGEQNLGSPDMEPGVYACLTIADTGIGMDKSVIDKIFDPFFTTKGKGKGTGMGLSVVHGIVKGMGGFIQVYSQPGKGTQFHVYFPVEQSFFQEQVIPLNAKIQGGIEQILLVDDEDAILTMEKQMLERLGYQVTSRTSSIEALEVFCDRPDKFNLVITDMAMPNMTGDRLSAELTKIRPDIPVLLCTGFSETMSEEKATSLGIKGFLLKPIVMKDLAQKIREVLDENIT